MDNENKYSVIIDVTIKDEKIIYNLSTPADQPKLNIKQVASILSGALALTIRGSENEAQMMTDVINYLNHEFTSIDSFNDIKINQK